MHTARKKLNQGFTLIEILIVVGILALLAALSVPEYIRFLARSKRAEAYILLNAGHKAQMSYFAGVDHFLKPCPGNCGSESTMTNNLLGIGSFSVSRHGYDFDWFFADNPLNYQLTLWGNLDEDAASDQLVIAVNSSFMEIFCTNMGYESGVPFLFFDDLTERWSC